MTAVRRDGNGSRDSRHARKGDRTAGSASVELTLITPLLILLLLFVVAVGRLAAARLEVDAAARQAARAASIARDAGVAAHKAHATAERTLGERGLTCRSLRVEANTAGLRPGGRVSVRVSCTIALSDLAPLPGSKTLSASFSSPVDVFRGHR